MFLKYKKLKEENKSLKAENECLKKLVEHTDGRMAKQWENFFRYDGTAQPGVENEN